MNSTTNPISASESSENREVRKVFEAPENTKKRPPIYELLTMVLLDTFTTQLHIADLQTKIESENSNNQVRLINEMDKCKLQDIPLDAWGAVKVQMPSTYHFDPITMQWDEDKHYRYSWQLIHPEKLSPIKMQNQQNLKMRQDLQCGLSVLKQNGQLTITSATTTLKESSQTSTLTKEMMDTAKAIINKIARMKG